MATVLGHISHNLFLLCKRENPATAENMKLADLAICGMDSHARHLGNECVASKIRTCAGSNFKVLVELTLTM